MKLQTLDPPVTGSTTRTGSRTPVGPISDSENNGRGLQSISTQSKSSHQAAQNAGSKKTQQINALGPRDTVTVWPDNIEKSSILLSEKYVMIPRQCCIIMKNSGTGKRIRNNSSAAPFLVSEEWIDSVATAKPSSANGTKH